MNTNSPFTRTAPDESAVTTADAGGVRVLTLNRPAMFNSLHPAGGSALRAALAGAAADRNVRVLVLTGAGGNFCTGADLKHKKVAGEERLLTVLHECLLMLRDAALPSIAAIEGNAYGAGMSLALGCDYIVAAEGARFCAPFTGIGLIPDVGMAFTLPRRVGVGRARQWMFEGTVVDAELAAATGLADEKVSQGSALEAAIARAALWTRRAPLAIAALRGMMNRCGDDLKATLAEEVGVQAGLAASGDFAEGVASFRQRRPPVFKGV